MIRKILLPACLAALLTTACSSESRLPDPTGKGSVGAINAIPGSPTVTFRIEERSLGNLRYQASSAPAPYDDFDYVFNFDIGVPGESEPRRIASVPFKVEANRDHVFVLTGDLASPSVTTWTTDQRTWQESDTVFEARFAHLSESLGDIDVYLHDPDNPPAAGTQVATLSRGDVMDFADFAADTYRVTITAAGAIGTVQFQTDAVEFIAQNSHTLSLFDGDENDVGPYILTSMTATGQAAELIDPSFPPTINIVHAAQTLQAVDVYDDEALTNLLAPDISLGQSSGDLDTAVGTTTFYFTPTSSVATTLFSSGVIVAPGSRSYLYLAGPTDEWQGFLVTQDRSSSLVSVKLILFNGSVNHPLIDLYALERGVELDDDSFARAILVGGGLSSPAVTLTAGSYDVYVTTSGTRTILDGPFELDAEIGDVVSLLAVDDVDPEIVRLVDPFGP